MRLYTLGVRLGRSTFYRMGFSLFFVRRTCNEGAVIFQCHGQQRDRAQTHTISQKVCYPTKGVKYLMKSAPKSCRLASALSPLGRIRGCAASPAKHCSHAFSQLLIPSPSTQVRSKMKLSLDEYCTSSSRQLEQTLRASFSNRCDSSQHARHILTLGCIAAIGAATFGRMC